MFVGKAGAYPCIAPFRLLAKALAYFENLCIMSVKSVIMEAAGANFMKLFTAIIY
jgi:hypothetical protein